MKLFSVALKKACLGLKFKRIGTITMHFIYEYFILIDIYTPKIADLTDWLSIDNGVHHTFSFVHISDDLSNF